jgi:hypothetical protein
MIAKQEKQVAINDVKEVLHRIRAKLYPNYLPNVEGDYIARTENEAALNIEQVCAALKTRGGFSGDYGNLVSNTKAFFEEAAYQLCDGFSINTGYYSIHPNISGTFNSAKEVYNQTKNPVRFRFRTQAKLRRLAEFVTVEIKGVADVNGWIDTFTDIEAESVNGTVTSCNQFVINGSKIKIAGNDPSIGLYLVNVEDGSEIKVSRIAENAPSKIIGLIPETPSGSFKIVIKTQYVNSGTIFLKNPRVITSDFALEKA